MSTSEPMNFAYVVKAEDLLTLNYLPEGHPRPNDVEWINRGGDAKFYSALALWFPLSDGPMLALCIAVSGLLVLIMMSVWSRIRPLPNWSKELPYGAAIATGAIVTRVLATL